MPQLVSRTSEKNNSYLLLLVTLFGLLALSAVIPASWFGIKPISTTRPKIDLSSVVRDADGNKSISWKELINSTLPETGTGETAGEIDPETIEELNDPNNLTASFSKNLYVTSASLATGPINNPEQEQAVITQLIAEERAKIKPTTYTFADLHIDSSEDKTTMQAYGNTVATALDGIITEKKVVADGNAFQAYLDSKDKNELTLLKADYARVNATLGKLETMSIPLSAAAYHALLLTRVAAYRDLLGSLASADTDPIRAAIMVEHYPETIVMIARVYDTLSTYFSTQNIVFTSKQSGYVFTIGYTLK